MRSSSLSLVVGVRAVAQPLVPGFFLWLACLAVWITASGQLVFDWWRDVPFPPVPAAAPDQVPGHPQMPDPSQDRLVSLGDPDLPASIREAAAPRMAPGFTPWCCPRSGARGRPVVEWWLLDAQGGLVEAFWER